MALYRFGNPDSAGGDLWVNGDDVVFIRGKVVADGLTEIGLRNGVILTTTLSSIEVIDEIRNPAPYSRA